MTIKKRLNILALLSIGTILLLYGYLWYNTMQINDTFNQINNIDTYTHTASELDNITQQYLAYGGERHIESWNQLYSKLTIYHDSITSFPNRKVIENALPSIKQSFELIKDIRQHPENYPDTEKRNRLLERAESRIRSDIQLLLSATFNIEESHRDRVHGILVNQQIRYLIILIPTVFLIAILVYSLRRRIFHSIDALLAGARNIGEGSLEQRIELKGNDEPSELAEEFNNMAVRLNDYIMKAEENRKRWEKLVEQDPSMILIHKKGVVRFINPAGVEMIGASGSEDLIGRSVTEIMGTEHSEKLNRRLSELHEKRNMLDPAIYKITRLDGKKRYMRIESMLIELHGEEATQTVGLDITEHVEYEEQLKKSLQEIKILLQEVHHRVKNNLAVISGILELQAMESDDQRLKEQLNDSKLRIQSMSLIHNLLYETENFSNLNFKEHIIQLVDSIMSTMEISVPVDIEYDVEDVRLDINQAIPCALMINEMISNSFKHAFNNTEEGKIRVCFKELEDSITLKVQDNGDGLPEDFDIVNSGSLGLTLVNTLASQLDADIEYQNDNWKGFIVSFEKNQISELKEPYYFNE